METPADTLEQANHSHHLTLEHLPSEIKVMILCQMPKLSSLSSIVHASPAYHQAYCGAREEVLHAMTVRTLQDHDIGLLDPWTAVRATPLEYHTPRRLEIISGCLKNYAQGRVDGSRRRLTPEDSLAILNLQRKFTVLIADYCGNMFSQNPLTRSSDDNPLPPTQFELHRLYRALWRYEIYSKVFGPDEVVFDQDFTMRGLDPMDCMLSEEEIALNFFGLFPAHEVEEFACLQKYASDFYNRRSWMGADFVVALGPGQLYESMTAESLGKPQTHEARPEGGGWTDANMRHALDAYERIVSQGAWQWKGIDNDFNGKHVPTNGWLWASSRGIQNTDFRLRRWGYVFWDQERLDHWGLTKDTMVNWPYPRLTSVLNMVRRSLRFNVHRYMSATNPSLTA